MIVLSYGLSYFLIKLKKIICLNKWPFKFARPLGGRATISYLDLFSLISVFFFLP